MKVLLTTLNAKYVQSSLALRYLEKYCKNQQYEIVIEEYTINDYPDMITADIYKTGADVIAFSCYIWNITMTLEIADRLKKVCPDRIIIVGGPEVSYDALETLKKYHYIDYVVMGEGEETLNELLRYLHDGQQALENIQGIAYRSENGDIMVNRHRPLICNLDNIPRPYNQKDLSALSGKIIYYETSRGCPFNCSYCLSSTILGVRFFSLKRVKADLLFFIENNVKQIKFVDRTFNFNKDRTMELLAFLVANRKNTSFHFEIAADLLDDKMIEFLAGVPKGLFQFEIGVQSTNLNTISAIQRKTNFERLAANVKQLRKADNIHLHLDLIAGLPYEDYQSFQQSFDDVFGLSPHVLQLGFLKLLKGSKIREEAKQHGYKYATLPPYEILENNKISYCEILRLKGIEDIMEKYYNSGAFQKSLTYILANDYQSPFIFFEDLSKYFEAEGLNKLSHSRKALYDIFFEFYIQKIKKEVDIFREYLKFDLLYHQKGVQLPYWAKKDEIPHFKERCFEFLKDEGNIQKFLPHYTGIPAKKIIKQVNFYIFDFDVLDSSLKCNVDKNQTVILHDYQRLKVFNVTEEFNRTL
ncbi:MAG: hypothetical protein PWQ70_3206 [Clostridiales bacterium]|jgi:radical SAM superfamily enzyme YgiQ (UPF0313 family)|nr:hypothetical protein [Clostridiales bacterium]